MPVPGRTATELARRRGQGPARALPANYPQAANAFNDVTYGERPGTESAYRMIADLDDHLRSRTPTAPTDATATAQVDPEDWAEVR